MNSQRTPSTSGPTEAAILERSRSLANEALLTVALQRRRFQGTEPEDEAVFLFRRWADAQFLIVALRRLRTAASIAGRVPSVRKQVRRAIKTFDAALPFLTVMRNVGEHIDDYALDSPTRHHREVSRRMLQVGSWSETSFNWLNEVLDVDSALAAAQALYAAVRAAQSEHHASSTASDSRASA